MRVTPLSHKINDDLAPRCGRCDVVMDLIATRTARRHTLRTFCCPRCGISTRFHSIAERLTETTRLEASV